MQDSLACLAHHSVRIPVIDAFAQKPEQICALQMGFLSYGAFAQSIFPMKTLRSKRSLSLYTHRNKALAASGVKNPRISRASCFAWAHQITIIFQKVCKNFSPNARAHQIPGIAFCGALKSRDFYQIYL